MVAVNCQTNFGSGMRDCQSDQAKPEKKNTYTEFIPNPENDNFRKKYLGVKKRYSKTPNNRQY